MLAVEDSSTLAASLQRIQAYQGLAENLRRQKKYKEAELVLSQALENADQEKPHFHFLLGQHYHMGGRPFIALEHLQASQELLPEVYQQRATALIDDIWLKTPACLLRPPQPAYR